MTAGWCILPDAVLRAGLYTPLGFQGGPGEIGVLYSHWLLTWDAVDAESA